MRSRNRHLGNAFAKLVDKMYYNFASDFSNPEGDIDNRYIVASSVHFEHVQIELFHVLFLLYPVRLILTVGPIATTGLCSEPMSAPGYVLVCLHCF